MTVGRTFTFLALVVFLLISLDFSFSQSLQNATNLREHLFVTNAYDKISRPKLNQTVQTEVSISLGLYAIYDLDEVGQTLKFAGFLEIEWQDEMLVWDPSAFGGLSSALYPQDMVWRPDLALKNSVEDYKALGDSSLTVNVQSNGLVLWQPYQVFKSMCLVDITYYPYDRQTCEVVFVTWGYNNEDIIVKSPSNSEAVITNFLLQNSEWTLVNATWETTRDPKPMMIYHLTLCRKPQHVLSNIVLPLIVLSLLNIGVFILPCNSGERSSYAVTVFLSFVVFATIVQSTLPANSDSQSYLSLYINFQIFESATITIITLVCIRLIGLTMPVPKWLQIVTCQYRRPTRLCNKTQIKQVDPLQNEKHVDEDSVVNSGPPTVLFDNYLPFKADSIQQDSDRLGKQDENTDGNADWQAVVNVFDRILFVFLLIINSIATIILFAIVNTYKNNL